MALSESEISALGGEPVLGRSLDSASRRNPDLAAEALKTPFSDDYYQKNKPAIENQVKMNLLNPTEITRTSPRTATYLKNPDNAAVSSDDIEVLRGIEELSQTHDRTWGEFGTDSSIDVAKGVINLGEGVVGLSDLITFNAVGDALENIGFDPRQSKDFLSSYYSKSRQTANLKVERAQGFVKTLETLAENPSAAFGTILESAPLMIGGMAAVRAVASRMMASAGVVAGTPEAGVFLSRPDVIAKLATVSGVSEGALTAGMIQEEARQAGRGYLQSAPYAVAAGALTALTTKASSKFLPDVEVSGALSTLSKGERVSLLSAGKQIAKSMFKEGALEELPQSAQEQVFTNLAMDKPWDEGVGEAAAQGLVAGTGMGFGMSTVTQTNNYLNSYAEATERHVDNTIRSVVEQQEIEQIVSYAQSSTTNTRDKTRFESFINTLGPDRSVLIPVDAIAELEDAPALLIAEDGGPEISVPLSRFATEIAPNEAWMNTLRPHIRLSDSSMTQSEIESGDKSELQSLLDKAQEAQETLTEADTVFQTVKDQLVSTGMQSEETARFSAQLYPAAATVWAEKARNQGHDVSVDEVFEMMGFRVEAGKPADIIEPGDVTKTIFDQGLVPDDLEITMDMNVLETGETTQESFNAKELSMAIDSKLESYQAFRDCL